MVPASQRSRFRPTGSCLRRAAVVLLALISLAGCGKKGALYLPGEAPPPPAQSAPEG